MLLFILLLSKGLLATGIEFTFANGLVSGSETKYYEFDVMAQATNEDSTRLGDNQVYINYNTAGFGEAIANNGKVTVEKGTLLEGGSAPSFYYEIINVVDNTASKIAITTEYNYPDYPEYGNELTSTPQQLLHITIEIADTNETAGLSFDEALMDGQQFQSDNTQSYSPVVATDTDDNPLNPEPSALVSKDNSGIPDHFALKPNYPNPFNPVTTLRFDVPHQTANLELTIYDVLGRNVRTLYEGSIEAGTYEYQWNGRNRQGERMPTGVYFAVMKTSEYSQAIKMMLVK